MLVSVFGEKAQQTEGCGRKKGSGKGAKERRDSFYSPAEADFSMETKGNLASGPFCKGHWVI